MGDEEADPGRWRRRIWIGAIAVVAALAVVRNLVDLAAAPPGLYVDEASIGYNAWTMAHFGVDEHGIHIPLFFEAFGEYKNPVYVYSLAALLRFLPLTVAVERLPAAIFGLVAVGFLTATAWRLTGSRVITLGFLALCALTPWLVIESRVGFETISMVALLSAAIWCLAGRPPSPRQFGAAGVLLAFAIYAYTTARLEILLLAIALGCAWGIARTPGWWRAMVPVVAGYGVLGVYMLLNPGALTGRFALISIWADGASLGVVINRFLVNYVSYFGAGFLFLSGDANPRQNTEIGGMLLWVMVPLLLAGILVCWQRRREPLARFLVASILLAPIAAALTNNGTPHALRSSLMLPFLIVLAVAGRRRYPPGHRQPRRPRPPRRRRARGGHARPGRDLHARPLLGVPEPRGGVLRHRRGRRDRDGPCRRERPRRLSLEFARSAVHRGLLRAAPTAAAAAGHRRRDAGAGGARHAGGPTGDRGAARLDGRPAGARLIRSPPHRAAGRWSPPSAPRRTRSNSSAPRPILVSVYRMDG